MKVTENQIKELYTFVQKHYVEWYDVQTELVDHLANGIENQWKTFPNKSFDDALTSEFKKFGVFGFQDLVEKRINALNKYYRKEVWKYLKEYFKLPKLIITSFSIWSLFKILQLFEHKKHIAAFLFVSISCCCFYYLFKKTKQLKKTQKESGKKWLFENSIAQTGGFIHLLNIGIYMPLINFNKEWDTLAVLSFSGCIVIYALMFFVSVKVVPPKLKEKMSKQHPEYNFAKNT